jgi:group I intron endonuclease
MRFIYLAKNLLDGKCYVGQTKDFNERVRGHLYEALKGKGYKFHAAIRKHGKENFTFEAIEECEDEVANERERVWIERFDSFKRGYNLTSGGDHFEFSDETIQKIKDANSNLSDEQRYIRGSAFRGKHLSEEHKQKLREANKGKIPPCYEETRRKRSKSMKGKNTGPKSEEHRKKLSEAHCGKKLSDEHKEKLRNKPVSEETRQKLSEAGKGRIVSEETRRKKSESMKGKKFGSPSQETIEKRTAKTRGRKRTEEQKQRMRDGWARKREEKRRLIDEQQQLLENPSK